MKNRKLFVFIIINFELLFIFILLVFKVPDILKEIGGTILVMLVLNGAQFIGGNVWHAWQKSKHFVPDLKDKEDEK